MICAFGGGFWPCFADGLREIFFVSLWPFLKTLRDYFFIFFSGFLKQILVGESPISPGNDVEAALVQCPASNGCQKDF